MQTLLEYKGELIACIANNSEDDNHMNFGQSQFLIAGYLNENRRDRKINQPEIEIQKIRLRRALRAGL